MQPSTAAAASPRLGAGARVVAIIPARAGSTRLPRKPLARIGGMPMVTRVARRVAGCPLVDAVIVTTDDDEIAEAVLGDGHRVVRVDIPCASGTARVARAAEAMEAQGEPVDLVINVQGDEPFIEPEHLGLLVERLASGVGLVTLAAPLDRGERENPHVVKVEIDAQGFARRFTRQPSAGDRHVGVYGFSRSTLAAVADLPRGPLATAEDLEQVAWMEAGWRLAVLGVPRAPLSVDSAADLAAAQRLFTAQELR